MARIGWIVPVRHQPLQVAAFVYNFAVLIGIAVSVQVDWLLADRAGERIFFRARVIVHISLISRSGELYQQCALAYSLMSNSPTSNSKAGFALSRSKVRGQATETMKKNGSAPRDISEHERRALVEEIASTWNAKQTVLGAPADPVESTCAW